MPWKMASDAGDCPTLDRQAERSLPFDVLTQAVRQRKRNSGIHSQGLQALKALVNLKGALSLGLSCRQEDCDALTARQSLS